MSDRTVIDARPPTERPTVVVVVPARDEAASIGRCIDRLGAAARYAVTHDRATAVHVVVVAHRCVDDTAAVAMTALDAGSACVLDTCSVTVGAARATGVDAGLDLVDRAQEDVWVFSSDADSEVPVDWIARGLTIADSSNAHLVLGVTTLDGPFLRRSAHHRYDALIARQRRTLDDHDHVYGANLAVRSDVYCAVGGFPDVSSGEDAALVRACRASGYRVTTPTAWSVATSARLHGRAPDGLADLLRELVDEQAS